MVKKKPDLGDMVWVKYTEKIEYPAYLVTSNNPEKVLDEETGKYKVEVEWNTGYNSRDWVYVDDILPNSGMTTGEVGRGQRANKQTPQEATAKKEEEMAAWLAARRPPAPPKKPRAVKSTSTKTTSSISIAMPNSSRNAQEEDDEDDDDEEDYDDDVIDLCSSDSSNSASVNSEDEEEDEDEVEYMDTRRGRTKPPGVVTVIEPYGLYDPRINYDDESDDDDDKDDGMDVDGVEEDDDDDDYDSNDSLVSGSDSEEEHEEEDADSFRKVIRQQTTTVYENAPPGTILQTIVETVHADLGLKEVTFDSSTTIAKQVVFLMKHRRRPRIAAASAVAEAK